MGWASLAMCIVSRAEIVVSSIARAVSLIISRPFRSLIVLLISFAVSRTALIQVGYY